MASGERRFCSQTLGLPLRARRSSSATSGATLGLQQLRPVQLAEEADGLVLRRGIVAEARGGGVPDLLHRCGGPSIRPTT